MKFEDLTNEQIEKAKACTTPEEKRAFLEEYGIELLDDMLDSVSGGLADETRYEELDNCPADKYRKCNMVKTGNKRPGKICGDIWPNVEYRCTMCGRTIWDAW